MNDAFLLQVTAPINDLLNKLNLLILVMPKPMQINIVFECSIYYNKIHTHQDNTPKTNKYLILSIESPRIG